MFVHWLEVGGKRFTISDEDVQWGYLKDYMLKYPDSKITVYNRNAGDLFARVVKLECKQKYRDLDIDCNSGFTHSIRRLDRKPNNIEPCRVQSDYFFNRSAEAS